MTTNITPAVNGPGKYDPACVAAREITGGSVLLIVIDGEEGHGFSAQATAEVLDHMPMLLRDVANSIEAGNKGTENN